MCMGMSQLTSPTLDPIAPEKLLRSGVVTVMMTVATGGAAPRRMGSDASRPVKSVEALLASIAVTMVLSVGKT